MGMQVSVPGANPQVVAQAATEQGLALRMVDNLPAFPDEAVPDEFQEIRLAGPSGMISVRSGPQGLTLVVWGNAEEALRAALAKLAGRLAELSSGTVLAAGRTWQVAEWLAVGAPLVEA